MAGSSHRADDRLAAWGRRVGLHRVAGLHGLCASNHRLRVPVLLQEAARAGEGGGLSEGGRLYYRRDEYLLRAMHLHHAVPR